MTLLELEEAGYRVEVTHWKVRVQKWETKQKAKPYWMTTYAQNFMFPDSLANRYELGRLKAIQYLVRTRLEA